MADHDATRMEATIRETIQARLAWLKSTDPFVRLDAVQVIGNLADEAAFDPLIFALWDEDVYVRAYAAEALGKLQDKRAITALSAAMQDREFFVRAHVVLAMGELGNPEAMNPLFTLLLEGEEEIKPYAVWALGTLEESGMVKSLSLKSLIAALRSGAGHAAVGRAFKRITAYSSEKEASAAGRNVADDSGVSFSVRSARIAFEDGLQRRDASVHLAADLKAPLTVDDTLAMAVNGVDLFSVPLSRFRAVSDDPETIEPSDGFVPPFHVYQTKHLTVSLCAVTGRIQVGASKVNLHGLDPNEGVAVTVRCNEDSAVDNFEVAAGGGTLVFPITP